MNPAEVELIIVGIEQLTSYILQARANGKLTDAALAQGITAANAATRTLITNFIAGQTTPTTPPVPAT